MLIKKKKNSSQNIPLRFMFVSPHSLRQLGDFNSARCSLSSKFSLGYRYGISQVIKHQIIGVGRFRILGGGGGGEGGPNS